MPAPKVANSELIVAVKRWAANHPRRDEPLLVLFGSSRSWSPQQIADELQSESDSGKMLRGLLENAARSHGVPDLIASFDAATTTQAGEQASAV